MHIVEYYSAITNNEVLPYVITWTDPIWTGMMPSEISSDRGRQIPYYFTCKGNLRNRTEKAGASS